MAGWVGVNSTVFLPLRAQFCPLGLVLRGRLLYPSGNSRACDRSHRFVPGRDVGCSSGDGTRSQRGPGSPSPSEERHEVREPTTILTMQSESTHSSFSPGFSFGSELHLGR